MSKRRFLQSFITATITDAAYAHARRVCKDFEIKNLGECHDLYVQSNISSLVDVFENFQSMS